MTDILQLIEFYAKWLSENISQIDRLKENKPPEEYKDSIEVTICKLELENRMLKEFMEKLSYLL